MDLYKELEEIIKSEIKDLEQITNEQIVLDYSTVSGLLRKYLTIMYKLVLPVKPRKVEYSKELKLKIENQAIPQKYLNYLYIVIDKFEKGKDLNPYLSEKTLNPDEQDGLLFDWKIHHLHLSNEKNQKYFYIRSKYQLLFYLENSNVYLIDVRRHPKGSEWAFEDILEIFDKNWPEILEPYKYNTVQTAKSLSSEDRYKFRKAGIMASIEVNGKVFFPPGGGFPTDGSSAAMGEKRDHILNSLDRFNEGFKKNPDKIRDDLIQNGFKSPDPLLLKLVLNNNDLGLLEETNPVFIPLGIYWPKIKDNLFDL